LKTASKCGKHWEFLGSKVGEHQEFFADDIRYNFLVNRRPEVY
jgi:hypothetical protein